jgi:uncharacterized FlaG/YvyC family protein
VPERKAAPQESRPEVSKALGDLGKAMQEANISLKFTTDQETGRIVIQMIDEVSGDTVQQIPDAAMLHVAAVLGKLQGRLFDETV